MGATWADPPGDEPVGIEGVGAEPESSTGTGVDEPGPSIVELIAEGQDQTRRGLEQLGELQAAHRESMAQAWDFLDDRRAAAARHHDASDPWA